MSSHQNYSWIVVREEKSKSKSGLHMYVEKPFIVSKQYVREAKGEDVSKDSTLYKVGYAKRIRVRLSDNEFLAIVKMVRNPRGIVKGCIEVYNNTGIMVYRAVYRKLKVRRSVGDPKYAWVIEQLIKHLKLPVKRINLGYKK